MSRMRESAGPRPWVSVGLPGIATAAVALLIVAAAPQGAQAGDDFERGFKRELGAIAAHEAVGIGRHILGGVIAGPYGYRHSGYRGRYAQRSHYGPYNGYGPRYGYHNPHRGYRPHRPRIVREHHHYHYNAPCYD